jgi:hypothetical protein
MTDTLERLPMVWAWDRARAIAVIREAVWQVTQVDTTLVRHHLDTYDSVMAGQGPGQRELIEGTLAGLRFVRNHSSTEAGLAEFIQADCPGPSYGGITSWTWKPVLDPELALLSPDGLAWEMTRYRAYRTHVAGHAVGETFVRAAAFLLLAAAKARSITVTGVRAGR